VLKLSAIRPGRFVATEAKALPPEASLPQRALVSDGDVLITRSNTLSAVGYACIAEGVRPLTYLSDLILRIQPREDALDASFLVHALSSRSGRAQIEASARGTSGSMRKISRSLIREYVIPLAPLERQRSIVAEMGAISSLIASAERMRNVAHRARTSIGASLLTGAHVIPESYDALLAGAASA
jgi:type I restriction enzyme S subunit